jgi:micrococcal nuclease
MIEKSLVVRVQPVPKRPSPPPPLIPLNAKTVLGVVMLAAGLAGLAWNGFHQWQPDADTFPVRPAPPPGKRQACAVLSIIDGDTFGCDLNGNGQLDAPRERIRLLGIDTPEMNYTKRRGGGRHHHHRRQKHPEPFAQEATDFARAHLAGRTVYLERDIQPLDRYDRTLAYVYFSPEGGRSFNEIILENGLAVTLFIPPNGRDRRLLLAAQKRAQETHRGLWRNKPEAVADSSH